MPISTLSLTALTNSSALDDQKAGLSGGGSSVVGQAVANLTLQLIEELATRDGTPMPNTLTGFLRFVASKKVSGQEADALIAAGLIEVVAETPTLTKDGQTLLSVLCNIDLDQVGDDEDREEYVPTVPVQPFAAFVVGDRTFEIGDGEQEDQLMFRPEGGEGWAILRTSREEGWDQIGAEILRRSGDTLLQYMQMHVLHQKQTSADQSIHRFEIDNISWWLRLDGSEAKIRSNEEDQWLSVPSDVRADTLRNLGVLAAREVLPEIEEALQADMSEWLKRMAHAATVRPIMSFAS